MTTLTMPKRVISVLLAATLAATLIPAEALPEAYAAPAQNSSQASDATDTQAPDAQDATQATGAEGTDADVSAAAADTQDSRPASVTTATERVAEGTPKQSLDMTRASVNLTTTPEACPIISQGALSFQVNTTDTTAALVGISPTTDAADITIPNTVNLAGKDYPVTRIIGGGGSAH